ncbi:MAG: SUMF1/EgtB/PvdO family nonheme iron enzyme [Myxococcota bacterium]
MIRRPLIGAVVAMIWMLTGCAIEQVVTLEEDLSGTAVMDIEMDLEQMITPLLAFAPDEASREELRQELLTGQREKMKMQAEELEEDLPEGITATIATREDGLTFGLAVQLAFEHLGLLRELRDEDGSSPFAIDIVEEGPMLTLTFDAFPDDDEPDEGVDDSDDTNPFTSAMPQFSFAVTLEAPFEVVEHNGTQKGNRVSWRLTMDEMKAMEARGEKPPLPRIVYLRGKPVQPADPVTTALSGKNAMPFVRTPGVLPLDVATTAVTQRQWKKVVGGKPSSCEVGCGKDLPVQNVSWNAAVQFANRLSEQEGLPACYAVGDDDWAWPQGRECPGFRLPTEAEWRRYRSHAGLEGLDDAIAEWLWDPASTGTDRKAVSDQSRAYPVGIGQSHVGLRLVRSAK